LKKVAAFARAAKKRLNEDEPLSVFKGSGRIPVFSAETTLKSGNRGVTNRKTSRVF
jgi:hypothetical protein